MKQKETASGCRTHNKLNIQTKKSYSRGILQEKGASEKNREKTMSKVVGNTKRIWNKKKDT